MVLIKASLNGGRDRADHAGVPLSPEELARDARSAVEAGAHVLHVHPRGEDGQETLDPAPCGRVVQALRTSCPGVPFGFTTGGWIEPDPERRLALIGRWTERPDFVSVNFSEEGAVELCQFARRVGMDVEAGTASEEDARLLLQSGEARRCLRVLVEPQEEDALAAVARADAIERILAEGAAPAPRLHHGAGPATWAVVEAALRSGRDVRIGLEDVLTLPDGAEASGNAELVAVVVGMSRRLGLQIDRGAAGKGHGGNENGSE